MWFGRPLRPEKGGERVEIKRWSQIEATEPDRRPTHPASMRCSEISPQAAHHEYSVHGTFRVRSGFAPLLAAARPKARGAPVTGKKSDWLTGAALPAAPQDTGTSKSGSERQDRLHGQSCSSLYGSVDADENLSVALAVACLNQKLHEHNKVA